MVTPTDPLYAQQWHLPMLGNIQRIWDEYTGSGVTVAVYDDGLQFTHLDLAANYNASAHFSFGGITYAPTPIASSDAHGTACAGLIAAVDNNGRGGTGVAHGATLTGLDFLNTIQLAYDFSTQTTSALYDAAMQWAAGFDIMSNSWGSYPGYYSSANLNISGNFSAVTDAHFEFVSQNGRGGLGTIIVKAAGNDTANANGEGLNVSRYTISVAATEDTGFAADYSNFGACILITAPAASVTTDLMGEEGYNSTDPFDGDTLAQTDYTSTFNGTSAATPVVAGVVALMLDANATLGWRDVQSILAMSASHTGSAVGAAASTTEVGTWLTMGGNQWNGGGSMYHLSYGFGMVDAFAATRMAEVWSRLYGAAHTSANEINLTSSQSFAGLSIPDSDGNTATPEREISFAIAQDIVIDSIQITIDLFHSYASDLLIMLRSPSGQLMTLLNREGGDTIIDHVWTFAAEGFRGMSSLGTWVVEIHDRAALDTGTVYDVQLDVFGSTNTINDVYHFTDDFAMLRGLQAGRQLIDDTNGGIDWLDFSAVTSNLTINLNAGGTIKFGATVLASFAAGAVDFERLQSGDGNDRITSNNLTNEIYLGRGNDWVNGGGGHDRLFGDAGNDTLLGSWGNDIMLGGVGNDSVAGGAGNDTVRGDAGNDTLVGGEGNDIYLGGAGNDVMIFETGFGIDRVNDWRDNQDTLHLDDAIWGGGLTVAQVISTFGSVVAGSAVLTFSASAVITLQGLTNLNSLSDDITII